MTLADQRVILQPRPMPVQNAVLDVVMLGHCAGKADLDELQPDALTQIRSLGLTQEVEALEKIKTGETDVSEAESRYLNLYQLPVPLLSLADFQNLFPDASKPVMHYESRLAGRRAWLAKAVEDFFHDGSLQLGAKRLWVIRIPENEGIGGFLPKQLDLSEPENVQGIGLALLIPNAGLLAMPDLERITVPKNISNIPDIVVDNTQVTFLPCNRASEAELDTDLNKELTEDAEVEDTEVGVETETINKPNSFQQILTSIMQALYQFRPDMQCLLTLPLQYDEQNQTPSLDYSAIKILQPDSHGTAVHGTAVHGTAVHGTADNTVFQELISRGIHRVQMVFPYLRNKEWGVYSPVGLLAGEIAQNAAEQGIWYSIAGRDFATDDLPFPSVQQIEATKLRENFGIGVLLNRSTGTQLDDERLARPWNPKYGQRWRDNSAQRSAELVRFMGQVQRDLMRLGEQLAFDLVSQDQQNSRPHLLLDHYLHNLHERGALRGAYAEQAYEIRQIKGSDNLIKFEIEIAPALPVDLLRLSFSHEQGQNTVNWQWETADA